MARRSLPPLFFSLLFTPQALVAPGGEGARVLPGLSDVHYELHQESCQLNVSWAPVQPLNYSCSVTYESDVDVDGNWFIGPWYQQPNRTVLVPLGNQKKLIFGARATCDHNNKFAGEWYNITVPQTGTPGTGARNLSCIWLNMESIQCSWQRGKNASPHTLYNLSYWLKGQRYCTDYTQEGDVFGCTFRFSNSLINPFGISVHGNSEEIQTVCLVSKNSIEENFPIKLHTPKIVDIKESSDGVYLTWTRPREMTGICYQVEVNSTETKIKDFEDNTNNSIPLALKGYHTFRVRSAAGYIGTQCKAIRGHWSDWSESVDWGKAHLYNGTGSITSIDPYDIAFTIGMSILSILTCLSLLGCLLPCPSITVFLNLGVGTPGRVVRGCQRGRQRPSENTVFSVGLGVLCGKFSPILSLVGFGMLFDCR